ncbi:UNVERIFIED_ORG: hypothetical protein FHR68_001952 [Xanthomonas campestris]
MKEAAGLAKRLELETRQPAGCHFWYWLVS